MTDSSKTEKIDSRFVNNGTPNFSNCMKKNRTICLLDGVIDIKGKARTESKIVEMIIDTMTENNFDNGIVGISHCLNEKIANKIKEAILIKWPNSKIQIGDTRGLCSFYAEKEGVIVAYY